MFAIVFLICIPHLLAQPADPSQKPSTYRPSNYPSNEPTTKNRPTYLPSPRPSDQPSSTPTRSPSLKLCDLAGRDYRYIENFVEDFRVIEITGCPNHPPTLVPTTGYWPTKNETTFHIPIVPYLQGPDGTKAILNDYNGTIGVMFSGAMLRSPYAGEEYGYVQNYDNSITGVNKTVPLSKKIPLS